jgi:hypothetical protein
MIVEGDSLRPSTRRLGPIGDVYQRFTRMDDVPRSHQLHYLQMACEKLAKAYRLRDLDVEVDDLTTKHVGFAKFINAFLRSPPLLKEYKGNRAAHQAICKFAAAIARAIEGLAPAIGKLQSPANAEYPWESGDRVVAPCDYAYPELSLLGAPGGRAFLKVIDRAFRDYASLTIR